MVNIPHHAHPKGGYYMEDSLFKNIMPLKKRIDKDKDVVGLCSGVPGVGKSTLIQQIAYPLDPHLNINSIKYSARDVIKYSLSLFNAGKSIGRTYIHDEAKEVASATKQMSKKTKKFMDFIYENRQMNMYQWLLNGDFFDIPKQIVMERAMFMVYVHEAGEFQNGFFKFYNRADMKALYLKGKEKRDMKASKYTFRGRFPKFYTVDEEQYRELKRKHLLDFSRYIDDTSTKDLNKADVLRFLFSFKPNLVYNDIKDINFISDTQFYRVKRQITQHKDPPTTYMSYARESNNKGTNELNKFLQMV